MINRIKTEHGIDPMAQLKASAFNPYLNMKPPTKLSMSPDLTKMTNNDQNSFNWNDFDYAGAGKIVEAVGGIGKYIAENVKTKRPPLAYTIGLYGNGGNLFDIGGKIGAGIQGLTSIAGSFVDGYATEDINPTLDELHNRSIDQSYAQNFNDLANEYSQYRSFNTVDARDVRDKTWAEDGMNILGSIGSGAAAGASVGGPWGALVGGVIGLAGSTTGVLLGRAKADKKADKLNKQIRLTNEARQNTLGYRAETLSNRNYLNDMQNFKDQGGPLHTNGGLWDNGLMYINNGGTHEQSPYEGVPMGVDQQGIPNLVEEGEVIWNDYVFSDRLNVPKGLRSKYKLGGKLSFAKAVDKLSKESKEKPFDPIIQNTLDVVLDELRQSQEEIRMKKQGQQLQNLLTSIPPEELAMMTQQAQNPQQNIQEQLPMDQGMIDPMMSQGLMAYGGSVNKLSGPGNKSNSLNSYGYIEDYNNGWFDENNKYHKGYLDQINSMTLDDWQKWFDKQRLYFKDTANRGTARWNAINEFYQDNPEYNSDTFKAAEGMLDTYRRLAQDRKTGYMHPEYAQAPSLKQERRNWIRNADGTARLLDASDEIYFSNVNEGGRTWEQIMSKKYPGFKHALTQRRDPVNGTQYTDYYYDVSSPKVDAEGIFDVEGTQWKQGLDLSWMRGIPAAGSLLMLGQKDGRDYTNADAIASLANTIPYQGAYLIPSRLKPRYVNTTNAINSLTGSNIAAIRAAAESTSNPLAAMNQILALDQKYKEGIGAINTEAQKENWTRDLAIANYLQGIDSYNTSALTNRDQANRIIAEKRAELAQKAATLRESIDSSYAASRSANWNNFLENMANLGIDSANRRDVINQILSGNLKATPELMSSLGMKKIKTKKTKSD